jgi:hypothetical protein
VSLLQELIKRVVDHGEAIYPHAKHVVDVKTGRRIGEVFHKGTEFGYHHDSADYGAIGHDSEQDALEDLIDTHNDHRRPGRRELKTTDIKLVDA